MDPSKERHVTQKRQNYYEGHDITYSVRVSRLFVLQSWEFKRTYKTECEHNPTSWYLELKFLEVRQDASACVLFTFRRIDSEDVGLEACVWVQICNLQDSLIFPKLVFERNMLPGDELQKTVEVSAFPDKREAVNRGVVVNISIMICFCHADGSD